MVDGVQVRFTKQNPIIAVAFLVDNIIYHGTPTDTHGSLLLTLEDSLKERIVLALYSAESLDKPLSKDIQDGFITDTSSFIERQAAYTLYK